LIGGAIVEGLFVIVVATLVIAARWFLAPIDRTNIMVSNDRIAAAAPGGPDRSTAALPVVSGNVVDARTQTPIANFTVITGSRQGPTAEPGFDRRTAKKFIDGQYRQTMGDRDVDAWFVKIEAPGHLPAISPPMNASGTADFQLQPAADVVGRVLDADGNPATGLNVGLADPTRNGVYPIGSRLLNSWPNTVTDGAGRFEFTPQTNPFAVIAYGPAGFAEALGEVLAKNADLRLTRWGQIDGQVWMQGRPWVGAEVFPNYGRILDSNGNALPVQLGFMDMSGITTDRLGKFHFDRFPPGDCTIYAWKGPATYDPRLVGPTAKVTVVAGQKASVIVGDCARDVNGGLTGPAELLGRKDCTLQAIISLKSDTRPTSSQDKLQLALKLASARRVALVGSDGSFHFADVGHGDYDLVASVRLSASGVILAEGHAHFTVPPSAMDEASTQPLEIGDVALTADTQERGSDHGP